MAADPTFWGVSGLSTMSKLHHEYRFRFELLFDVNFRCRLQHPDLDRVCARFAEALFSNGNGDVSHVEASIHSMAEA